MQHEHKMDRHIRTSIIDVAKRAGVSPSTVSRVINGTATVSSDKKRLVEAAIQDLNFEPNRFARSLIINRSEIIGVIIDRSIRYATANVLVQLEEHAASRGYMSMVFTIDRPFHDNLQTLLAKYNSVSIDGLIVIAPRTGLPEQVAKADINIPVVVISSQLEDIGVPMVGEDQYQGAYKMVDFLAGLGHKRIWHVSGGMDWFDEQQRRRGWNDALLDHGLSANRKDLRAGSWNPQKTYEMMQKADLSTAPDAIFVASDHMAMAAIAALKSRGIAVPKDISVVGYDDTEGAEYASSPLTTVLQDLPFVARKAVELLINMIDGEEVPMVTRIEPKLIVRESAIAR